MMLATAIALGSSRHGMGDVRETKPSFMHLNNLQSFADLLVVCILEREGVVGFLV